MTTLVLCMAGLYRRFREAGYTTPKYLLTVRGRTILSVIVDELRPASLILVANHRDREHEAAIRAAVGPCRLLWIGDTGGQAETAAIGARAVEGGGAVVFHNVDTIVTGRDLDEVGRCLETARGYIDVFDNDSPVFSYVAVEDGRIVEIREKVVISRHATTGLYGFASAQVYLDACAATSQRSGGEFYISDVYQTLLNRGERLVINASSDGHETLVLGTPAQYEAYVDQVGR
jgi:dTDP-glucose pyrophosphorylase